MAEQKITNRLINEKSPYLLQHAHNPVDWYPWTDEAFEKAERENKPVFLSIGYSTCHWCHVMEHESFEDVEVAEMLNEHFVSIKVDREERPDVDHLYMTVCQAISGQGGWPLTIIMTPEKDPFFAGTYYPKHRKYGRIGLMDLLDQLKNKWQEDSDKVRGMGSKIVDEVKRRMLSNLKGEVSADTLDQAFSQFESLFNTEYGGFGKAPKFPSSHNLSFLLRYGVRTGNQSAIQMAEKTLDQMYRGGMYDHVGFGFARYSTDEKWLVPHFEKMLYDNALLAWSYLEGYQATGNSQFAEVAHQIFTYVLRDMTHPEGGFYSAEDADSEGHEGKFYVWDRAEVMKVLGEKEGTFYCERYDITVEGNFEGQNIPNLIGHDLQDAAHSGNSIEEIKKRADICRQKLFETREQRIHPGKDDKILTSWNGLMIMALSKGYKVLSDPTYLEAAESAVQFIRQHLRESNGRLLARYRDGEAKYLGYVDDYAFLVWGLLELYEASFKKDYLQLAIELNEQMIELFWDEEDGGLFFYGSDNEQLFTRNKETYDGAMPSGNSVAALNIQKIAKLTYNAQLSQTADRQVEALAGAANRYPTGHSMFLVALEFLYSSSSEVVIAGDPEADKTKKMIEAVRENFRPNQMVVLLPPGEQADELRRLIPMVQDKGALNGQSTVYVCENFSCQAPTTDLEELKDFLR